MGGQSDGLVVVCGASWWHGTPLLERHIAEELGATRPVLYVDPPTSVLTRYRNDEARRVAMAPGLRQVGERTWLLSVRVPPMLERPGVKQLALAAVRRAIRQSLRRLGSPQVEALVVPNLEPLFGCAGERTSVLYVKDDYLAGAALAGVPSARLARLADRLPREADVVVAVSEVLAERLRDRGIHATHIPNGVDVEVFSDAGAPPRDEAPLAAFVGHLSERVDPQLVAAVADAGVRVRMIGARQETMAAGHLARLESHPGIEWVGPLPYAELGRQLADVTTCLLPYADTDFNRASFPLKILEYLAAGRRVVATDLPAIRWLDTPLVTTATGPRAFAEAVRASTARPLEQDEVDGRRSFARGHAWAARTRQLEEAIGLHGPAGRGGTRETALATRHGARS